MPSDARTWAAALSDPALPEPPDIAPAHRGRFAIHRNNCAAGMAGALEASFPAVAALVGEAFFAGLARAYLAADPPRSPLLFDYGGGLAGFIEGFAPAAALGYLPDVARLEWARLRALHAADADTAALADLAALGPQALEGARLALHPAAGLVRSRWPVHALWAASTGRGAAEAVDLGRVEAAAIARPGLEVLTRPLPPGAAALMARLAQGEPLAPAIDAAQAEAAAGNFPFDLATDLSALFEIGAIAAITAADRRETQKGDAG